MTKPKLLVLAANLPRFQGDLEYELASQLGSRVSGVAVQGSVASGFSVESLLKRTVLGEDTDQDQILGNIQRGCELYVGIRTTENHFIGQRTVDGRFDRYQIGERGFELAKGRGIPAILLDTYEHRTICDFVEGATR